MIRKIGNTEENENPLQREAFLFYYELGDGRTLSAVAKHFGKAEITVKLWSSRFNWTSRIAEKIANEHKDDRLLLRKELSDAHDELRRLINELIEKFREQFDAGKIRTNTIQDLERIVKLFLILTGEPSEIEPRKIIFEDVSAKDYKNDDTDSEDEEQDVIDFPPE